ncbi:hypothetical protein NP493_43g05045 [Ridgeia piscesae]|uniref:Trafficking protein particle complex subunit 13 n=1 Tax=Ridgeia piscesae TaxID=27915 RepID=A0AAD9PC79_RIDPI|nr:hypothetical protein NP493_43g05045 [Ridgeia piscesae]
MFLAVMRLTKPSLMMAQPILCSPLDLPQGTFSETLQKDLAVVKGLEQFALGELLTLPQNFGNIFLGETFSSYISVHNDSAHMCTDVQVKVDLQTSSQRLSLSRSSSELVTQLEPSLRIDDVIYHEVKELGTHILVCAVSYTSNTGEKMYFRKFFKFQVLKPLDVKTKFYNAESDEVYLEAQIKNITPSPIFMERVVLDPSPQYTVQELNSQGTKDGDSGSVFGLANYMNPLDVRQYLYCLTPRPEICADPRTMKGVTNIGKLDIVWKTNMGEKGRLQTSALQRVAPGYGDIRLTVTSVPDAIQVEKVFLLQVTVTNCCERTMDLVLQIVNNPSGAGGVGGGTGGGGTACHPGLLWCGISGRQLGKVEPNTSLVLDLKMIALQSGLQTVSGLRLTDTFLNRTYEHDEIAQVFVYNQDSDATAS